MRYKIYRGDALINTIIASEEFCKAYCERNGYTYELEPEDTPEPEQPENVTVTAEELIKILLGEEVGTDG